MRKGMFFTKYVECLGHIMKLRSLTIDQAHTVSLKGALCPVNKPELRIFFESKSYRRIVENNAQRARSLDILIWKHSLEKFNPKWKTTIGHSRSHQFHHCLSSSGSLSAWTEILSYPESISVWTLLFIPPKPMGKRLIHHRILAMTACPNGTQLSKYGTGMFCGCLDTKGPLYLSPWKRIYLPYRWRSSAFVLIIQGIFNCLMKWRFQLVEYNFWVRYKKKPRNVPADKFSQPCEWAKSTTEDTHEMFFVLPKDKQLESNDDLLL